MEKDNLVHSFNESEATPTPTPRQGSLRSDSYRSDSGQAGQKGVFHKGPIILFLILAVLGIGTGYLLLQTQGPSLIGVPGGGSVSKGGDAQKGKTFGAKDIRNTDEAEGTLREGGIDGEGAYHLERPGGESQNVYLTSSVLDLSQFMGKKVKVWGETHEAEKAGWLMDVIRLQVL